jgi:hypothetical protein
MLVLLTGLVMALLTAVRTDLSSSVSYEKGISTRILSETALNLAIGQIQEGTTRPREAWVSQPGLIRTFDTSGEPSRAYKLYSDDQMTVTGEFDPADGEDLPTAAEWAGKPDVYVDLNDPVKTVLLSSSGVQSDHFLFPIIDPRAEGQVEGFSFESDWGNSTPDDPKLAMPVKWLYLLEDGTLSAGVENGASGVTIAGSSATNKPTARLAFWTDDETSKVNINTASEGTPWDTPVANTIPVGASFRESVLTTRPTSWGDELFEADFAQFQPSQHEYQRYPGHPATTALSPILGRAIAENLGFDPNNPTFEQRSAILEQIYKISPRVAGGADSSLAGSKRGSDTLSAGGDRLFASVDELLFTPSLDGAARAENPLFPNTAVGEAQRRQLLEQSKFFLTANSRAPEVTLSNKPRVIAWPISENPANTHRTAFDRLIALCGTVGSGSAAKRFYFTRQNPLSTTEDWNPRNQQLFTYLQGLMAQPIPGFGGSFASKWSGVDTEGAAANDSDQVLMQIFDYIRCLNLQDSTVDQPYADYPSQPAAERDAKRGMVVPIIPTSGPGVGYRGFGRMPTVSELAFIFITRSKDGRGNTTPINLQLMLVPELFAPMNGWSAMATNMMIKFTEIDIKINGKVRRNDVVTGSTGSSVSIPFRPNGSSVSESNPVEMFAAHIPRSAAASAGPGSQHGQSRLGGYMSPGIMFFKPVDLDASLDNLKKSIPISEEFSHPNIVSALDGRRETSTDKLIIEAGSRVAFTIEAPFLGGTPTEVQSFEYEFDADLEIFAPMLGNDREEPTSMENKARRATSDGRDLVHYNFPIYADSVFSLVPNNGIVEIRGDTRIIAGREDIGNLFGPIDEAGEFQVIHTLKQNYVESPDEAKFGNLVTGINQYQSTTQTPDVPPGIDGVTNAAGQPGDWDNGVGLQADGAYLNKADEGTSQDMGDNIPYIGALEKHDVTENVEATLFSPNRQMPSAVMFGSLPTGVKRGLPWQTLLFRPARSYLPGGTNHPGSASPPDHLLLDDFWMPVVEPYAISEPFSTAGKINMNYAIAPFNYIRRDTGVRAVLAAARITAMNPTESVSGGGTFAQKYKTGVLLTGSPSDGGAGARGISIRKKIDADATLEFFEERFATPKPFISATEICDIPLVPEGIVSSGATVPAIESALSTFWTAHTLTGDNSLERPYAHIYPRLTTKSNTYTVHVRVQRLSTTADSADAGEFDSARDKVAGDFRGSFLIERFLDPNNDSLVTDDGSGNLVAATNENDPDAVLGPYKVRVLHTKQLAQ